MFILVTGPESSGTRWVSQLCASALGIQGHEKWDGVNRISDVKNAVMHRSLPHGGNDEFINIENIMAPESARFGGIGRIVVCVRDQTCFTAPSKTTTTATPI